MVRPKGVSRYGRERADDERKDKKNAKEGWKGWARDIGIALVILLAVLGGIYAYTQVWPPLVVVESSSMQHSDTTSYLGVIDTGDLVFVQAAPTRADVITYVQGRATGYATYGDYGDVIIFNVPPSLSEVPIIHRAILYVVPNGSAADVPDLSGLPLSEWEAFNGASRLPTPFGATSVTIHKMGFNHDLGITFNLAYFVNRFHRAGYVTMGDNNAIHGCSPKGDPCTSPTPYDVEWFAAQGDIIGHARGEIPWFGLIKLLLAPSPQSCAQGWGDPCAPANSWTDLALGLAFLVALPFIVEGAGWAWSTYAWPWIKPRLRRKADVPEHRSDPGAGSDEEPSEPKEGSSEP